MMSKFVRVQSGVVVEVFDNQPEFTPALMATIRSDAPNDVAEGWTYNGMAYAAALAAAPTVSEYEDAVQALLDATAKQRNYDGIQSACTYAASTNAQFKAEAEASIAWRDAIWTACYAELAAVQGSNMAQPSIDSFLAGMPKLTWPTPQA